MLVPVERWRTPFAAELGGAVLSLVMAVLLFTRFSLDATLLRDPSIYVYEGQQLSHGVPIYVSIFDPKTPLAGTLAGLAAALSRLVGADEVHGIRVAFFLCACLTVLAVYELAVRLWNSPLAGVVATAVFCSFQYFASQALGGPDAKTPGILLGLVSMTLLTRRRWLLAAVAASLSFLAWQPFAVYSIVVLGYTLLVAEKGSQRRSFAVAAAGVALPVAVTALYFWAAGALGHFLESALVFPLTGVKRGHETLLDRLGGIATVARTSAGFSSWPFWTGLVLLLVLAAGRLLTQRAELRQSARDPLLGVVLPSLLLIAAYSCADFQGPPDLFPGLPYAALGFGGLAAVTLGAGRSPAGRGALVVGWLAGAVIFVGFAWNQFDKVPPVGSGLVGQHAEACALNQMLGPQGTLVALGSPAPLVMTGRRNPDRFVYLNSGVDRWKAEHTQGGFRGWVAEIRSYHPAAIVVGGWTDGLRPRMSRWLESASGFHPAYLGRWRVFLDPQAERRGLQRGVLLTQEPTAYPTDAFLRPLPANCAGE